jgi:hypothetical protein
VGDKQSIATAVAAARLFEGDKFTEGRALIKNIQAQDLFDAAQSVRKKEPGLAEALIRIWKETIMVKEIKIARRL